MSSPIHYPNGLDAALRYAPPRVRDGARLKPKPTTGAPASLLAAKLSAPPPAAATEPAIQWPPRRRRVNETVFSGDLAVLDMQRRLDPEVVPEPLRVERGPSRWRLVLGMGAIAATSAAVAWAVIVFPAARQTLPLSLFRIGTAAIAAKQDPAPASPVARLVVHDGGRADVNAWLPVGVEMEGNPAGAAIALSGLPAGTRLSAGTQVGADGWRVEAHDLDHLLIEAPPAFVGTMDMTADLQLADNRIIDSRPVHLEWSRAPEPKAIAAPVAPVAAAVPVAPSAPVAAATPAAAAPARPPAASAALQLDSDEIATLLKRGTDAVKDNDLASARLLLRRAAMAGSAQAALALGRTFDPAVVRSLGTVGVEADAAKAREWYQKAAQLGSDSATQQLAKLAQASQ